MDALKNALANLRDATKPIDAADRVILLNEIEAQRKAADRYRWLSERFIGCDFDWMPSEENAGDGKSVLCFEVGRDCRVWGDAGMTIDSAMAKEGADPLLMARAKAALDGGGA